MTDEIKWPLVQSLNATIIGRVRDEIEALGKALPCTVAQVLSSGIVTVNFEVNSAPFTLPQITVPIGHPEYVRYPIKVGDKGWVAPADVRLGGITGLGSGVPTLSRPGNLAALVFYWLGNTNWSEAEDSNALIAYAPTGTINRDTNSMSVHTVAPIGVSVDTPALSTTGNAVIGSGATSTITTPTGQIATVLNGLITNVGSGINIQYFENIIKQTTNIVDELNYIKNGNFGPNVEQDVQEQIQAQLQNLTNQIIPDIMGLINSATAELTILTAAVPLVTLPVVTLTEVTTFLTAFQTNVLSFQILAPYTNLITQIVSITAQLASLTSAIQSSSTAITPPGQPGVQIPGSPSVGSPEKVGVMFTVTRA